MKKKLNMLGVLLTFYYSICRHVLNELIETEKTYVVQLEDIVQVCNYCHMPFPHHFCKPRVTICSPLVPRLKMCMEP